jgi:hypothetical protein
VRTRHLQLVSSEHSVTTHNNESVRSHFGPVSPGSTTLLAQETLRVNQLAQLTELLNSLENIVASLNYKSFEVYDTLNTAIEAVSVALSSTQTEEVGTDANRS